MDIMGGFLCGRKGFPEGLIAQRVEVRFLAAAFKSFGIKSMKIRYLVCMAGTDFVRNVGDIGEHNDAEAGRLIDAGYAEAVPEELPPVVANNDDGKAKKRTK